VCFNASHDCESTLTRFVWAGDQLLWEMRVPGGNDVPTGSTGLDATTTSGEFYGRVSYFHAGGIDKPLLITKDGVESVVPRETWRGQFHAGTSPTTGVRRDCPVGTQTGCLQIAWPGMQTNAAHSWGGEQPDIRVWYGGLVDGMRDASGQMYMRNRYYDPATGQFTQTDPIGLAGGMNAYGFAAGDPVSYSDPYGLCIWFWKPKCRDKSSSLTYGDFVHALYNPSRLMTMSYIRDQAALMVSQRQDFWGTDEVGRAKANAFRHIFGSCALTVQYGISTAREVTRSHERFLRNGDEGQAKDSRDDMGNNEIGMQEGRGNKRENRHLTCENIADREVTSGHYYGAGGETGGQDE
jgi:RHS repeat-associated protein